MIVYRSQGERVDPVLLFDRIQMLVRLFERSRFTSHEAAVELLIEFGVLEAALADAVCTEFDSDGPVTQAFREAGRLTGHLFYLLWKGKSAEVGPRFNQLERALARNRLFPIPERVEVHPPEGYAYYALYPETYLEAALRFFNEVHPHQVTCIGIRSIGTSLSSVVSAALEQRGCEIRSYTVRPRGHPFHRTLSLSPALENVFRRRTESLFLIVDEGPGLSGSSFASVAQQLSDLGVPDNRIILFPSWEAEGGSFVSAAARERWQRHLKYTVSFDEVWINSGRLASSLSCKELIDLSGGRWRTLFYTDEFDAPPVQPQHERRKYLGFESLPAAAPERSGFFLWDKTPQQALPLFMKFAGLGRYGRAKLARAERLAEAGFAPRPLGLINGFIITPYVQGAPLTANEADPALLKRMAHYLAFRKKAFPAVRTLSFESMMEMIQTNTREGLGKEWEGLLHPLQKFRPLYDGLPATAIDGRMFPHKWIRTADGYLKTDSLDHDNDHFFPGCQEIAWDLAGTFVEFALDEEAKTTFIDLYQSRADDLDLMARLPFYTIAYLSSRLGYATLAATTLGPTEDGRKFHSLAERYTSCLGKEIGRLSESMS